MFDVANVVCLPSDLNGSDNAAARCGDLTKRVISAYVKPQFNKRLKALSESRRGHNFTKSQFSFPRPILRSSLAERSPCAVTFDSTRRILRNPACLAWRVPLQMHAILQRWHVVLERVSECLKGAVQTTARPCWRLRQVELNSPSNPPVEFEKITAV